MSSRGCIGEFVSGVCASLSCFCIVGRVKFVVGSKGGTGDSFLALFVQACFVSFEWLWSVLLVGQHVLVSAGHVDLGD